MEAPIRAWAILLAVPSAAQIRSHRELRVRRPSRAGGPESGPQSPTSREPLDEVAKRAEETFGLASIYAFFVE